MQRYCLPSRFTSWAFSWASPSTSWGIKPWWEFFQYLGMKHGNRMFFPGGIKERAHRWKQDRELFRRWQEGRTGIPFLDAPCGS
ncbi:MAG: hypothetical protein NXI25_07015 [bacterium]|nr:hypothetical protein [bacterium]